MVKSRKILPNITANKSAELATILGFGQTEPLRYATLSV